MDSTEISRKKHDGPASGVPYHSGKLPVDCGLLSILLVVPLLLGGQGNVGRLVLVALVGFTSLAWWWQQYHVRSARWRFSGVEWLLLLGAILAAVQLIHLPTGLLAKLSPTIHQILPLWTNDASTPFGAWSQISLTPVATRAALVMYVTYLLLFLVILQYVETRADLARVLKYVAFAAASMAIVGLSQRFLENGRLAWFFDHPTRTTNGAIIATFQNQNHFAHFLALGIGPLVWWLLDHWASNMDPNSARRHSPSRRFPLRRLSIQLQPYVRPMLVIAFGLVLLAGFLTFSRGGVIAILVAFSVVTIVYACNRLLPRRSLPVFGSVGVVLVASLLIYGYAPLVGRLSTLRDSRSIHELSYGRAALWSAMSEGIAAFPLLGSGLGSHREVYPMYMEEHYGVEFTHGESGYLPVLLETGLSGLGLLLIGIVVLLRWCLVPLVSVRSPDGIRYSGAILAGLTASIVHSIADFVWYIPACMSMTVVLAGCACRHYQLTCAESPRRERRGIPRIPAWMIPTTVSLTGYRRDVATVAVATLSIVLIANRVGPALAASDWDNYLRLALADRSTIEDRESDRRAEVLQKAQYLEAALKSDSGNPRVHLRMAAMLLSLFEIEQRRSANRMSLSQIREAALASRFSSSEAQSEWLLRAIGKNSSLLTHALYHAQQGLGLCPLQGEGYMYLADLSFLEGPSASAKREYTAQAGRLRPFDAHVLYAAGKEAALNGDFELALTKWKGAFRQDPDVQRQLIDTLAPQLPAGTFLEHFDPDYLGLSRLFDFYRGQDRVADARIVGTTLSAVVEQRARSERTKEARATTWREAARVYRFLGEGEHCIRCSRNAVKSDPVDFSSRQELCSTLLEEGKFGEAIEQIEWCKYRRPGDPRWEAMLIDAKKSAHRLAAKVPLDTEVR